MTQIMRVRTVFTYGAGSPGLMTNYFNHSSNSPNSEAAQNAVNRVRDGLLASPNLWPTTFSWLVQGDVDIIEDTTGNVDNSYGVTQATGAGTSTNGLGPLPVGLLLRARTNTFVSGRRLMGRTFLVPVQSALTAAPVPSSGTRDAVVLMGTELSDAGATGVDPVVWSRPRPATEVGPGRPAGPARAARDGSHAEVVSWDCPAQYVVLTSRRD